MFGESHSKISVRLEVYCRRVCVCDFSDSSLWLFGLQFMSRFARSWSFPLDKSITYNLQGMPGSSCHHHHFYNLANDHLFFTYLNGKEMPGYCIFCQLPKSMFILHCPSLSSLSMQLGPVDSTVFIGRESVTWTFRLSIGLHRW